MAVYLKEISLCTALLRYWKIGICMSSHPKIYENLNGITFVFSERIIFVCKEIVYDFFGSVKQQKLKKKQFFEN